MDQAAPADQVVLRNFHERSEEQLPGLFRVNDNVRYREHFGYVEKPEARRPSASRTVHKYCLRRLRRVGSLFLTPKSRGDPSRRRHPVYLHCQSLCLFWPNPQFFEALVTHYSPIHVPFSHSPPDLHASCLQSSANSITSGSRWSALTSNRKLPVYRSVFFLGWTLIIHNPFQ